MKIIEFFKKKWMFLLFLVVLCLAIRGYDRILSIKSAHGIRQARDMYAQPKDTIDVVFMGSSHIHCGVNTAQLWTEHGIAGYDYSAAEQPMWLTYHYLKEICKTQKPKLLVLDVHAPARFRANHQYEWLQDNLNGVRFSWNKLQMLQVSCQPEKLWDFWPSIATYHMRYRDLEDEDWEYLFMTKEERASFKGYTPYFGIEAQEKPVLEEVEVKDLTEKTEKYLRMIIEYAREKEIELFFIVTPHVTTLEDGRTYKRMHEIAEEYDIPFDDGNMHYDEMHLHFMTDMHDDSHLNYVGSCKFTTYLGKKIKELYDVPDRRGDKRWESWDRHVQDIDNEVQEVLRKQQEALQNGVPAT